MVTPTVTVATLTWYSPSVEDVANQSLTGLSRLLTPSGMSAASYVRYANKSASHLLQLIVSVYRNAKQLSKDQRTSILWKVSLCVGLVPGSLMRMNELRLILEWMIFMRYTDKVDAFLSSPP